MTQYVELMEPYLAPVNPRVAGRWHRLLEETIYPFNYELLGQRARYEAATRRAPVYPGPLLDDYHWWIYFDDFDIWRDGKS